MHRVIQGLTPLDWVVLVPLFALHVGLGYTIQCRGAARVRLVFLGLFPQPLLQLALLPVKSVPLEATTPLLLLLPV